MSGLVGTIVSAACPFICRLDTACFGLVCVGGCRDMIAGIGVSRRPFFVGECSFSGSVPILVEGNCCSLALRRCDGGTTLERAGPTQQ